jgi:hypothetical protein
MAPRWGVCAATGGAATAVRSAAPPSHTAIRIVISPCRKRMVRHAVLSQLVSSLFLAKEQGKIEK